MTVTVDLTADIIDVRDIIERVKELESECHEWDDNTPSEDSDAWHELNTLTAILDELAGNGGDEQWRGDWYPITLIRDSYFVDYVQELLEDCGDIPKNLPHYVHIDWERTARDIRTDYSGADFHGVTYWYR